MFKQTLVAASLGLLCAGNALAVSNGDFSQPGLTGWTVLGDAANSSGTAILTTASVDFADDFPVGAGAYNISGIAAAAAGAPGGVEEFAGLQIGDLDLAGSFAYEGSVIKQSFHVNAGEILRFDWNFLTNETQPDRKPDFAFVVIDGALSTLAFAADANNIALLGTTAAMTGARAFSHTFVSSGVSSVAFGVVDADDYNVTSALWVENVAVVPEAETWAMLLAGLGLVGLQIRRKEKYFHSLKFGA